MRVHVRLAAVAALAVAAGLGSLSASAQGLHLKLSSETPRVTSAQIVKVKVQAVAMRSLSLPAAPVFLVDDGTGAQPSEVAAGHEGQVEVTPDKAHTGDYELSLSKPGTYKIQAEYRVADRPVRSNKVTVQVTQ